MLLYRSMAAATLIALSVGAGWARDSANEQDLYLLQSADPMIRSRAVDRLKVRVRTEFAAADGLGPRLLDYVGDDRERVRAAALGVLGEMARSRSELLVHHHASCLWVRSRSARLVAGHALGTSGEVSHSDLLSVVVSGPRATGLRDVAIVALSVRGRGVIPMLRETLRDLVRDLALATSDSLAIRELQDRIGGVALALVLAGDRSAQTVARIEQSLRAPSLQLDGIFVHGWPESGGMCRRALAALGAEATAPLRRLLDRKEVTPKIQAVHTLRLLQRMPQELHASITRLIRNGDVPGGLVSEAVSVICQIDALGPDLVTRLLDEGGDLAILRGVRTCGRKAVRSLLAIAQSGRPTRLRLYALDLLCSLGAASRPALNLCATLLSHELPTLRAAAARLIGVIVQDSRGNGLRWVDRLVERLADVDTEVQATAAAALGLIGTRASNSATQLEGMCRTSPSKNVRTACAMAACRVGISQLRDDTIRVIRSLVIVGGDSEDRSPPAFIRSIAAFAPSARAQLAELLLADLHPGMSLGDADRTSQVLLELCPLNEVTRRDFARRFQGFTWEEHLVDDSHAFRTLLVVVSDKGPKQCLARLRADPFDDSAFESLRLMGSRVQAVREDLLRMLDSEKTTLRRRIRVVTTLAQGGEPVASEVPFLIDCLLTDRETLGDLAARCLQELGKTAGVAVPTLAICVDDYRVRASCVDALVAIGGSDAVAALMQACRADSPGTRTAAIEALPELMDQAAVLAPVINELLMDPNPLVQTAALQVRTRLAPLE